MEEVDEKQCIRILPHKLVLQKKEPALQWLIGSPFLSPLTIVSTLRCIHHSSPPESVSPDFTKEAEELRTLLLKGFSIVGALVVGNFNVDEHASQAIDAARKLNQILSHGEKTEKQLLIGAVADINSVDIHFFVSRSENDTSLDSVSSVMYENNPEKYIWERGCLLRCELPISVPLYIPLDSPSDVEKTYEQATESVISKLRDPEVVYVVEQVNKNTSEDPCPVILRGSLMDFQINLSKFRHLNDASQNADRMSLPCANFCLKSKTECSTFPLQNADIIQVSVLLNSSAKSEKSSAPVVEYFPATDKTRLLVVNLKAEVLCYAAKFLPLTYAVSMLIIPGLVDQLNLIKNAILPNLSKQLPQLVPYHFCPPGFLHPITAIYELTYGETEMKQVELRKALHLRLGLPFDRPVLRIASALDFSGRKDNLPQKGSFLLKDVHIGIPSSGGRLMIALKCRPFFLSRLLVNQIQIVQFQVATCLWFRGHMCTIIIFKKGWGCAYRSLQTIISWFRLQHYTSIDVPSHSSPIFREIQEALVEIGDKDDSFIGSREWIGAIELSFVLDKLLGVSCKIINVRSGAELPEKCRELAAHFESQGTPIMIGGGVLAYTLLGVDYNEASGDCGFLILDPHYTGSDEVKKIVSGGWACKQIAYGLAIEGA
ncbi:putative Ufm1-specific protease [Cucumis melo var. makuwa]|uniref:Putative Ufm1-specific protease n=1 Tax=Cucumis melo var. makuwa TaxID=1194695 RepID=A0A5D3BJM4_CUCMM|nr:putative Ufm1-specific protease [Cucumis melo var. makuwa]